MIAPGSETSPSLLGQTEAPIRGIIRGDVRYRFGLLRQRMQTELQIFQLDPFIDGHRISDDMEVAGREIDDPASLLVFDIGFVNVPFGRDGPIESRAPRRDLVNLKPGKMFFEDRKGLPHPIARDASADREEPGGKRVTERADVLSGRSHKEAPTPCPPRSRIEPRHTWRVRKSFSARSPHRAARRDTDPCPTRSCPWVRHP